MIEREVATLLTYCAGADPGRFNTPDSDQAQARVMVWLDLLGPVDAAFALDHVRRYYSRHQDWAITPGAIRQAWNNHVKVAESKARAAALPAAGVQRPGPSDDALADIAAARERIAEHQRAFLARPRHPEQLRHPVPADG